MTVSHVSALGFCRATYSWQNGPGPLGQHWHGPKKYDPRTTRPAVNGTDTQRPVLVNAVLSSLPIYYERFQYLGLNSHAFQYLTPDSHAF